MIIELHSSLFISASELADYIPNSFSGTDFIWDKPDYKNILHFKQKVADNSYRAIETDFTPLELGEILNNIPPHLTEKLILALGKAGFELPQLYQVALKNNALDFVEKYLKDGADPNEKNETGNSYFTHALSNLNQEDLALLLLKYRADPHQWTKDTLPKTPLMIALQNKHMRAVDALLALKADPTVVGKKGQNTLHSAVLGGSLELIKKILVYQNISLNQKLDEETPLYWAIVQGKMEIVKELVSAKADVNESFGAYSMLVVALKYNKREIAEYLIEQKASCKDPNVLIYASTHPNVDVIEKILENKANVNATSTPDGKTAMHFAAENGHLDVVNALLNHHVTFDAESKKGTPLALAVQNNKPKVVELLLSRGANKNIILKNGEDLLTFAVHHNFPECVDLLIKQGCKLSSIDPYRLIDFAYQEGYRTTFEVLMQYDQDKINEYETKKQNIKFKKVSVTEIQKNSSYAKVFDHIYRETAARIFQRQWRKKHPSDYKIKYYTETLKQPLSMRFIQEPAGFKVEEHAKKIKLGQWLSLDYKDMEFERNLYKALRQKRITMNEMATAYFLYQAKDIFKDNKRPTELKQYSFDDKGPYSPSKISYSDKFALENFKNYLAYLPVSERGYFSIDFSRKSELVFLCDGLKHGAYPKSFRKFQEFIIKFIKKMPIDETEKNKLLDDFSSKLSDDFSSVLERFNSEKIDNLVDNILNCYPDLKEFYLQKQGIDTERETPRLLVATYAVGDQDPSVEISPHYDENNPDSPLLCQIIPTISSGNALQKAMHGSDSTYPFFTAGQVSTRLIRKLDETKYVVGSASQARPVEFQHPDLVLTPNAHGITKVHASQISGHDMFHCWRNGAITIKPIIRYLRNLYESVKGYDMSKYIWKLTDMDMGVGRSARISYKKYGSWEGWEGKSWWINDIIRLNMDDLYQCNSDHLFITLIDMVKNEKQWIEFLGKSIKKHFEHEKRVLEFLDDMKKIIAKYPNQSTLFYILAYRLAVRFRHVLSIPEGKTPLKMPHDTMVVETDGKLLTVYWRNNQGIQHNTIPVSEFDNFKFLPKVNETTDLVFLVKNMRIKFACTPYQYADADVLLDKFSENPKLLDEIFAWDRNEGIQFQPHILPVIEKKLEKLTPKTIIEYCNRCLNKLTHQKRKEDSEMNDSLFVPSKRLRF